MSAYAGVYLGAEGGLAGQEHGESSDSSAGADAASRLGGGLGLGSRVVVGALGLEEDGVLGVSPEVGDRVSAVSPARVYLQSSRAQSVRARLALLLLPGLVAYGRSQVHPRAVGEKTLERALEHAQAGLFEYADVVVVGVPHGPARGVSPRLLAVGSVNLPHVSVRPLAPLVQLDYLKKKKKKRR